MHLIYNMDGTISYIKKRELQREGKICLVTYILGILRTHQLIIFPSIERNTYETMMIKIIIMIMR